MGVLSATARACLEDCQFAVHHLKEANDQRFGKRDSVVYATDLFTMRVASAERAYRRARESFSELVEFPTHSRVHRVCKRACDGCADVLNMVESRQGRNKVAAAAASLLRHCHRSLA